MILDSENVQKLLSKVRSITAKSSDPEMLEIENCIIRIASSHIDCNLEKDKLSEILDNILKQIPLYILNGAWKQN